jgi:hypothetical protein
VADRLVLHIGSMKSGTSFVQNVLGHNKARLQEEGVLFAGERWRGQVAAVRDLIGRGGEKQEPLDPQGPWLRLVDEINAWPGTAVVSMEFLGPRSPDKIRQIIGSFSETTGIDAVLTCRDLARNIPAMWLESVQNGAVVPWEAYLESVRKRDGRTPSGRNFWRHQDLVQIAERWSDALGQPFVTLVTVPQRGAPPGLLWERFASLLDVDPAGCDLAVRANPAIGLATALLLRQLNQRMVVGGKVPAGYDRFVKHELSKRGLVHRQEQEPRLGLDEAWVTKAGRRQVQSLERAGYRVVGDLAELEPRPVSGVQPSEVPQDQILAAAVDGIAHLVTSWAEADRKSRRQERRRRRLEQQA